MMVRTGHPGFGLLLMVILATASFGSCTGASPSPSVNPGATVASETSPTMANPPASTSSSPGAPPSFPTPEGAAQRLYEDWRTNDQAAALQVATSEAVSALFSRPWNTEIFDGCLARQGASGFSCSFASETVPSTEMVVVGNASAGYRVESVRFET